MSEFKVVRADKIYAVERDGQTVEVVLSNGERVSQSYCDEAEASAAFDQIQERFIESRKRDLRGHGPQCIACDFYLVSRGSDYYCGKCERKYKDWEVANRTKSSDVGENKGGGAEDKTKDML